MVNRFSAPELQEESTQNKPLLFAVQAIGNLLLVAILFLVLRFLEAGRLVTILVPTLYGGISSSVIFYFAYTQLFEPPQGEPRKKKTRNTANTKARKNRAAQAKSAPATNGNQKQNAAPQSAPIGTKQNLPAGHANLVGKPKGSTNPAGKSPPPFAGGARPKSAAASTATDSRPRELPQHLRAKPVARSFSKPQLSRDELMQQFIASQPWVQLEKRKEDIVAIVGEARAKIQQINGQASGGSQAQRDALALISRMAKALNYRHQCIEKLMHQALQSNYNFDLQDAFELVHGDLIVDDGKTTDPTIIKQESWESTVQGLLRQL